MATVTMPGRYRLVYVVLNSLMDLLTQDEQVRCVANAAAVDKCHVRLGASGVELDPLALRYVWPGELDLMARLAGLRLLHRWGAAGPASPSDSRSLTHVSAYGR